MVTEGVLKVPAGDPRLAFQDVEYMFPCSGSSVSVLEFINFEKV